MNQQHVNQQPQDQQDQQDQPQYHTLQNVEPMIGASGTLFENLNDYQDFMERAFIFTERVKETLSTSHGPIGPQVKNNLLQNCMEFINIPEDSPDRAPILSLVNFCFDQSFPVEQSGEVEYEPIDELFYNPVELDLLENRRKTFDCWPKGLKIDLEKFLNAGLYYTGERDLTRCFVCGWEYADWSSDDDPIKKHIVGNQSCEFNLITFGCKIIEQVMEEANNLMEEGLKQVSDEIGEIGENFEGKCILCFTKKIDMAFLPCGHACCCSTCYFANKKNCPFCRKSDGALKIFIS